MHSICIWIVALSNQDCQLRNKQWFHHANKHNASSVCVCVCVFQVQISLCFLEDMNQYIYRCNIVSPRCFDLSLSKPNTTKLISCAVFPSGWIYAYSVWRLLEWKWYLLIIYEQCFALPSNYGRGDTLWHLLWNQFFSSQCNTTTTSSSAAVRLFTLNTNLHFHECDWDWNFSS